MKFVLAMAGIYGALCGLLYLTQRSLIYFPQQAANRKGSIMELATGLGAVLVSTRPLDSPNALIYFGGNAEDVSLGLPQVSAAFPNHALYLMNYRGYAGSAGSPSEANLIADGRALFDLVRQRHSNIVVMGRSLGSGVALPVASSRPVSRLILITPFDSLTGVAAAHFRFFPVRWLLRDKFESWRHAEQIRIPTTMIAAGDDEVIPRASTELLRTRFREGFVSYSVIPGAGHNTISDREEYWRLVRGEG